MLPHTRWRTRMHGRSRALRANFIMTGDKEKNKVEEEEERKEQGQRVLLYPC